MLSLKISTPNPPRTDGKQKNWSIHCTFLEFPSDLPPGEYELRLVVYDFETLKPTVELGVWEPETTLTRLQLGELK